MSVILKVENVSKKFDGLIANENISFEIHKGEIVGIVGPNGAGKTTLFNLISGSIPPSSGKIYFKNQDITKKKAHTICQMGMGRTFQIPQALEDLTIYENIFCAALCRVNKTKEADKKVESILKQFSLEEYKDRKPSELNVLQKKRLEIGRAMATDPELILLDEVMAGLTGTERKDAIDLIFGIQAMGITIVMIEHIMEVIMTVSDRIIVLNSGKQLVEGLPSEIAANEQVIRVYLGG